MKAPVKHSDEKEDKALIKKMVRPEDLKKGSGAKSSPSKPKGK